MKRGVIYLILFSIFLLFMINIGEAKTCVRCSSDKTQICNYECPSSSYCNTCISKGQGVSGGYSSYLCSSCGSCSKCGLSGSSYKCINQCSSSEICSSGTCCKDIGTSCSSNSQCCINTCSNGQCSKECATEGNYIYKDNSQGPTLCCFGLINSGWITGDNFETGETVTRGKCVSSGGLDEVQLTVCQSADTNNNCDILNQLNIVTKEQCCSELNLCCSGGVSISEFKVVLIDSLKDYFTHLNNAKLNVNELKDLIVVYFKSTGSTISLSGVGDYSKENIIDIYNKAKNNITITKTCANEGVFFSQVYKNEYPEHCCEGLTEWMSGMDTSKVENGICIQHPELAAGSPVGTCIKCGDGVCKSPENLCNCPLDCKNNIPSTPQPYDPSIPTIKSYLSGTPNFGMYGSIHVGEEKKYYVNLPDELPYIKTEDIWREALLKGKNYSTFGVYLYCPQYGEGTYSLQVIKPNGEIPKFLGLDGEYRDYIIGESMWSVIIWDADPGRYLIKVKLLSASSGSSTYTINWMALPPPLSNELKP